MPNHDVNVSALNKNATVSVRASSTFRCRSVGIRNKRPRSEYTSRRQRLQMTKKKSIPYSQASKAESVPNRHSKPINNSLSRSTNSIPMAQSTITSILTHWLRSCVCTDAVHRRHLLYILTAYSIQSLVSYSILYLVALWVSFPLSLPLSISLFLNVFALWHYEMSVDFLSFIANPNESMSQ